MPHIFQTVQKSIKMLPLCLALGSFPVQAINTTYSTSADALVKELLGSSDIQISNFKLQGSNVSSGFFSGGSDIIGFESGIVLSSGDIADVVGPNTLDYMSGVNYLPGDSDLNALIPGYTTYDSTVLEFDFVPQGETVSFQYVFTSDEYNEWVNTPFNDIFAFFLDGVNVAKVPGTDIAVAINNVNGGNPLGSNMSNPQHYVNNDLSDGGGTVNTEMDGLTVMLSVQAKVVPGQTHHFKFAVADAGDYIYDSNVFMKAQSFKPVVIDGDGDGIPDADDNCIAMSNSGQMDSDGDGVGDMCDVTAAPPAMAFVKMTGGGAVADGKGGHSNALNNFGFNIKSTPMGIEAHVEYNDGDRGKASKGQSPLQLKIKANLDQVVALNENGGVGVEFTAPCTVRTLLKDNKRLKNTCRVTLVDYGNPKKGKSADVFHLEIIDGPDVGYDSGNPTIVRGNIKSHKE
jgi:hypothetical protein